MIKANWGMKCGIPVGISLYFEKVRTNPEADISRKLITPRINEMRILNVRLIKYNNF